MGANRNSNLKKCGEISIDINSKNRKNKTYIFHCIFCNLECDQLKKFSLHIGEEHLKNFDDILKEDVELKFEIEPEEIRIPSFTNVEGQEIRTDSFIGQQININTDPLDTVNPFVPVVHRELSNSEVKHEIKEDSTHVKLLDYVAPIENSDIEEIKTKYTDTSIVDNSDTENEITNEVLDKMPLKKRKLNFSKKGRNSKHKHTPTEFSSDDSKDGNYTVEKESNTIKKHKRCKKRWKNIDDSKLPILIEIYKKYEVLWQVNDIAFGILPKRNEAFAEMIEELKSKHNFNKNLDELQDYIDYINYIFYNEKEQELKCELDKTEFYPSSKFYKELYFLSDSQGPFKCPNCNDIITKYDRFHIHVAQHNGSIPFQCRLCEMGFQKFDNYLRHVTRHLGINSYHCNVCGKGYPFKSELDWHLTSHTGVKPYLCPICGAGFRARHGYDNHIRRHEKRFRYECHICKHGFNHLCKLNTHIKSHLNIRDVICNVCGKGFTAAKYLQRHKLIHEAEKRYKCNICGKAFAQDSGLRTHRKQHQPYSTITENKNVLNKCV